MAEARAKDNLYGFSSYPPSFDTEPPPFSDSDDGEDNSFDNFVSASNSEFGYAFANAQDESHHWKKDEVTSADQVEQSVGSEHLVINGDTVPSNAEKEKVDNDSGWADFGAFESHAETSTSERLQNDTVEMHRRSPVESLLLTRERTSMGVVFDSGIPVSTGKSLNEAENDREECAEFSETVTLQEPVDRNCTNLISKEDKIHVNHDFSSAKTAREVLGEMYYTEEVSGDDHFELFKESMTNNENIAKLQSSKNCQSIFDHYGQEDDFSSSSPELPDNAIVNNSREYKTTSCSSNLDSTSISVPLHESVHDEDIGISGRSGVGQAHENDAFDRTEREEDDKKDIPLSLNMAEENTNSKMSGYQENLPVQNSPNNNSIYNIYSAEDCEYSLSKELDDDFDDWASFETAKPLDMNFDSSDSSQNFFTEEKHVDHFSKVPDHSSIASCVDVQISCTVDSVKDSDDWASFTNAKEDTYHETVTKETISTVSDVEHTGDTCIDASTKRECSTSLHVHGSVVANENEKYGNQEDSDIQQGNVHDQTLNTFSSSANDENQCDPAPNFSKDHSDSDIYAPSHSPCSFQIVQEETSSHIEHIDVSKEQGFEENSSGSNKAMFSNDNDNQSGADDDFDDWASFESAPTVNHSMNEHCSLKQGSALICESDQFVPNSNMMDTLNEGESKRVIEKAGTSNSSSGNSNEDDEWASFSSFETHDAVGVTGTSGTKCSGLDTSAPNDYVMEKEGDVHEVELSHDKNSIKDDTCWASFTSFSNEESNETDAVFSKEDMDRSDLEFTTPCSTTTDNGDRSSKQMCFDKPKIKLPLELCFGAPKNEEDLPHKKTRRKSLALESVIHDKYLQGEQSIWIQLKDAANRETSFRVIYNASYGLRWMLPAMDVAFENTMPRKSHKKSASLVTPQTLSPASSVGSFDFSDPILEPTPALLTDITIRPEVGRQTLLLQSQLKDDKGIPVPRAASSSSLKKDSGSENTSETTSLDLEFFSSGGVHPILGNLTQSKSDQQLSSLDQDLVGVNFDMQLDTKTKDEATNSFVPGKGKEQESSTSDIGMGDGPRVSAKAPTNVNFNNGMSGSMSSLAANFLEDLGNLSYMTSSVLMFPSKLLQDKG